MQGHKTTNLSILHETMAGHMNDGESHGTREEDLSGELRGEEGRIQGAPSRRMHPGCAVKKGVLKIDEHCEINWNLWNGAFSILDIEVHERNLAVLKEFIESHTRTGIERLKSETFEFAVEHANYLVHMGRGGVPKELILPGQFCSVFAGKDRGYFCWEDNPDFIENELRPHFEQVVRTLLHVVLRSAGFRVVRRSVAGINSVVGIRL